MPNKLSPFWNELKRRNVLRSLAVYAGTAFIVLEAADILFSRWGLPGWAFNLVLYLLILGAVISVIVSWIYDITGEGIEKTRPLKEDQPAKELTVSAAWKVATYVSVVVIIGLLVINIFGIREKKGTATSAENTLLVLPFDNYSSSPDQEYFCDGMTEEVISDLSRIHDILVISRNTAMSFKGTIKNMREIAMEANVRYVLEGSVRKDGNNLRITAQLIDTESDTHLWAENYVGTLDDIFDIQVKVSRAIADALRVKLSPDETSYISKQPIDNIEVYEYYLKARQEIYRFSEEGLDRAIQYLERGLQIDGENQLLYSAMGNAYFQYWNMGIRMDLVYLDKARDCAERIFDIEPGSYHGSVILGLLQSFNNPPEAIREFEFALKKDPHNEDALLWLCLDYLHLGLIDKAEPLIELLLEKDPLNSIVQVLPGLTFYYQGDLKPALESLEEVYRSDKSNPVVLFHYGKILASCEHTDQAILILDQCAEHSEFGFKELSYIFSLALQNKIQDASMMVSPDMKRWAKNDWMMSLWLAECHSLIGEREKAMDYLEQSVKLGGVNYPYLREYDVFLSSIRTLDRFQSLLKEVERKWQSIRES